MPESPSDIILCSPRAIRRHWPRCLDGPPLREGCRGKETPNGIEHWGATLFDFYWVNKVPSIENYISISTGSKLAAWMKAQGELDWASDELEWAEKVEPDPQEILPCDIRPLIEGYEMRIGLRLFGESMRPKAETSECSVQYPIPMFDFSKYPPPWPTVPFSAPAEKLEKRIPFHLLPETLVVHDPWGLLDADHSAQPDKPYAKWTEMPDIAQRYSLKLSKAGNATKQKDLATAKNALNESSTLKIMASTEELKDGETKKSISPPILAICPPQPPPPSSTPEAHLYLSPAHSLGIGNHSVVWNAEWELPRSLLIDDSICEDCVRNDVLLKREANKCDGPSAGSVEETMGTLTLNETVIPGITAEIVDAKDLKGKGKGKERSDDDEDKNLVIREPEIVRTFVYDGPLPHIPTDVQWQSANQGPPCEHMQVSRKVKDFPPTVKVRVAAKLSIQGDDHLQLEVLNYQKFPKHLFEHWSGYNVIRPMHTPVPVSAVVPQFYGYYMPCGDESSQSHYRSPIMLLEDCGVPIKVNDLGLDDKRECASLVYRLHYAGWSHGSVFERNFLVQPGPLSQFPLWRPLSKQPSFRLVDFGRSQEHHNVDDVHQLFGDKVDYV